MNVNFMLYLRFHMTHNFWLFICGWMLLEIVKAWLNFYITCYFSFSWGWEKLSTSNQSWDKTLSYVSEAQNVYNGIGLPKHSLLTKLLISHNHTTMEHKEINFLLTPGLLNWHTPTETRNPSPNVKEYDPLEFYHSVE